MDWETRYQKQDTPWDHGVAAPAIDEVIERQVFFPGAKVLVPGCGLGHDAQAWSDGGFLVTGLDISATALSQAESRYGRGGITWLQADLFVSDPSDAGCYDIVWEHTCFCAIPLEMRQAYVEAVLHRLKPGGLFCGLFFTDTGNPDGEGPPFNVSRDEVASLLRPHFDLQWEKRPDRAYESREGREWLMVWKKR